jgi:hypothetical protein
MNSILPESPSSSYWSFSEAFSPLPEPTTSNSLFDIFSLPPQLPFQTENSLEDSLNIVQSFYNPEFRTDTVPALPLNGTPEPAKMLKTAENSSTRKKVRKNARKCFCLNINQNEPIHLNNKIRIYPHPFIKDKLICDPCYYYIMHFNMEICNVCSKKRVLNSVNPLNMKDIICRDCAAILNTKKAVSLLPEDILFKRDDTLQSHLLEKNLILRKPKTVSSEQEKVIIICQDCIKNRKARSRHPLGENRKVCYPCYQRLRLLKKRTLERALNPGAENCVECKKIVLGIYTHPMSKIDGIKRGKICRPCVKSVRPLVESIIAKQPEYKEKICQQCPPNEWRWISHEDPKTKAGICKTCFNKLIGNLKKRKSSD